MLDLLEGRLLVGDLDGATAAIERALPVETLHGTMAWHHRHRYWVQQARFALATNDAAVALDKAQRAIVDAEARGAARYVRFGKIVAARAAIELAEPLDYDDLDATLTALDTCASMEGWLVTAELAAAAGLDRWWRDAERRAGALVSVSGEFAEPLRRWIGDRFSALGR
jgi:hypothetical protein